MDLDIERIREFIVLANTCNYQVASDALFTTASTLSKHIAQIEHELGQLLFDRSTRKVSLSDSGKIFLKSANQIVYQYDRAVSALRTLNSRQEGDLSIAFVDVIRQYNFFNIIHDFSEKHPDYRVNLLETEAQNMNSLLHLNACDFAFASRVEFFGKDVKHLPFAHDELMLIVPKGHPLAQRKSVELDELRNESFVLHNSHYESDIFRAMCQEKGFDIKPMLTSANSSTVIDVVSNSMAISVLSRCRCMTHAQITRVAVVNLEPRITFDVYVNYLRDRSLTPAMQSFVHYINARSSI